ncbi:hypothetical protein [Salibacterium aidingense]|uniref:hypothetical protein n=1 Tax=Salibacterium aidingense TaxID=384933 RepID=UPI0004025025|nr:hypothetical protein [Salibacterium aidingense]
MNSNRSLAASIIGGIIVVMTGIFLLSPDGISDNDLPKQAGNTNENTNGANNTVDDDDEETSQNTVLLPDGEDLPQGIDEKGNTQGHKISENGEERLNSTEANLKEGDSLNNKDLSYIETEYASNDDELRELYIVQSPGTSLPPNKEDLEKETFDNVTFYFESTESPKIADRFYFIYQDAMFNVGGTKVDKEELKGVVRSIMEN